MATKRMFSKTITNSSNFLMMPQSSQNLYFHLGMNADDDGFCEHFTIMRMTESKPDDLKVLQAKKFVKVFDDKVLVVLDWKENNWIRSDRYKPSKYLEIYKEELKKIAGMTNGIPNDNQMDTQIRLDKNTYTQKFENFWNTYPKKLAKQQALKAWEKLNPDDNLTNTILEAISKFSKTSAWQKDNGQFIPYPATFLNGRRWEDEVEDIKDNSPKFFKY